MRTTLINKSRHISLLVINYNDDITKVAIMNDKNDLAGIRCKETCCADGCCSDGCNTGECSSSCCSNGCCGDSDSCCSGN